MTKIIYTGKPIPDWVDTFLRDRITDKIVKHIKNKKITINVAGTGNNISLTSYSKRYNLMSIISLIKEENGILVDEDHY